MWYMVPKNPSPLIKNILVFFTFCVDFFDVSVCFTHFFRFLDVFIRFKSFFVSFLRFFEFSFVYKNYFREKCNLKFFLLTWKIRLPSSPSNHSLTWFLSIFGGCFVFFFKYYPPKIEERCVEIGTFSKNR